MIDDATLRRILGEGRRVAVVGLSDHPDRPSHAVARYLLAHGYEVLPVNPRLAGQQVLGQPVVSSLDELRGRVDMVDVFRHSEDVPPVAEAAVRIGARSLWQQVGVQSTEADRIVRAAGLDSVMDRCTKIEHARLMAARGA